jgi:hypothetical protein
MLPLIVEFLVIFGVVYGFARLGKQKSVEKHEAADKQSLSNIHVVNNPPRNTGLAQAVGTSTQAVNPNQEPRQKALSQV